MSIKKIAEMTGASIATVSRVLNDPEYHCRKEGLREQIWNAAMELDYTPNEAARSLRVTAGQASGKRRRIQVLMTHTNEESQDPFFTELLKIVESQIHRQGCILSGVRYLPQLSEHQTRQTELAAAVGGLSESDGLVIIGKCRKDALVLLEKFCGCIVAINRNSVEFAVDEVTCDGRKLAGIAVEHLISLGHKKIAYAGETESESRYEGYLETLARHGLEVPKEGLYRVSHTEHDGFRLMESLQKMLPGKEDRRATAIFCANDILAIGMLHCMKQRKNLRYIPSIMGCDDIEEGQNTDPMLSTVHVPKEEMGYLAIMMLCDRIRQRHKSPTKLELQGYLMQRSSTVREEVK